MMSASASSASKMSVHEGSMINSRNTMWTGSKRSGQSEKKAAAKTENKGTKNYWEFYDLKEDPHELHNAFEDPKYTEIIKAMKAEILHQRQVVGDNDKNNSEILEIIARHWND